MSFETKNMAVEIVSGIIWHLSEWIAENVTICTNLIGVLMVSRSSDSKFFKTAGNYLNQGKRILYLKSIHKFLAIADFDIFRAN